MWWFLIQNDERSDQWLKLWIFKQIYRRTYSCANHKGKEAGSKNVHARFFPALLKYQNILWDWKIFRCAVETLSSWWHQNILERWRFFWLYIDSISRIRASLVWWSFDMPWECRRLRKHQLHLINIVPKILWFFNCCGRILL